MASPNNVAPAAPVTTFMPDWVKTSMGSAMNGGGPTPGSTPAASPITSGQEDL